MRQRHYNITFTIELIASAFTEKDAIEAAKAKLEHQLRGDWIALRNPQVVAVNGK